MYQWNSRMGTHLFRTRRREKQSQHETKVVWWKRRVNVLPCFHFICMVYVTSHLRHVYAPRAIHRWNAAPPGTSRTRIYDLSMLALFYVVLLSQIVLLLCVRAAMTIQADEPWLSCSWWSHSMPSFSTNPNLGHRLRHEEPPAAGDPCDTRSNTHGGPCRRPERTSHTRTRVKTPRWRGGIVRRGGCRTGRNCPRSRTRCSRARGRFYAVVTTYCGGTTVPLLALGLLGLVGALAAEMHLAALAGKHRRFFA